MSGDSDDELQQLRARVEELEQKVNTQTSPPPASPQVPLPPQFHPVAQRPTFTKPQRKPMSLERLLAGRLFAIAGGVLLLFAVVYLLVTAIDRGWIDEQMRIVLAFAFSAGCGAVGAWMAARGKPAAVAQPLTCVAAAGVYATLCAGSQMYGMFSDTVALAASAAVAAAAAATVVKFSYRFTGAVGMAGCAVAPLLVGAPHSTGVVAFTLIAAAAAMLLAAGWRVSGVSTAVAAITAGQIAAWSQLERADTCAGDRTSEMCTMAGAPVQMFEWVGPQWWQVLLAMLTLLGVSAAAAIIGERRFTGDLPTVERILVTLVVTAAAAVVLIGRAPNHGYELGVVAGLAGWHALIAAVYARAGLRGTTGAVTCVLLAVAAFDAFMVWLVGDGPVVVWLLSAQALAAAVANAMIAPQWATDRTVTNVVAVTSAAAAALLVLPDADPPQLVAEAPNPQLAGLAGMLAVLVVAAVVLPSSGKLRGPAQGAAAAWGWYLLSLVCVTVIDGQAGQLALSAGWAAAGLALFSAGLRDQRWRSWRLAGLGLLSISAVKVVGHDLGALDAAFRVLAAAACGVLMLTCTYLYTRADRSDS